MEKRVYILVRWDLSDNSETLLKAFTNKNSAKAEMENLEKIKGRKKLNYFITETELVGS
jgi:hypothetical protein